jgi:ParB-like chromosome segregation protein Spo0J
MNTPPLHPLHLSSSLSQAKLNQYARLSNEELKQALEPGRQGSLKVRPDGTIIDGHHRIAILQMRGIDVNQLPREEVPRT